MTSNPKRPFVKMPTRTVGRLLGKKPGGIYAAHELAWKISCNGVNDVINLQTDETGLGIGRRGHFAGLKVLTTDGTIRNRRNWGQGTFATEDLNLDTSGAYVTLPVDLLFKTVERPRPTKLIAFVLGVKLRPTASTATDIGQTYVGIQSAEIARRLALEAAELGEVHVAEGRRGVLWVCRDVEGLKHVAKNDHAKNDHTKNVHAPLNRKKILQSERNTSTPATVVARGGHDVFLSDWRSSSYFEGMKQIDQLTEPIPARAWWHDRLHRHLGSAPPDHLLGTFAHQQAAELAALIHETAVLIDLFEYREPDRYPIDLIMDALACNTALALREGRTIRSLAFIAEPLHRRAADGQMDWIWRTPASYADRFGEDRDLALDLVRQLEAAGIPIDARELLTGLAIETLKPLCDRESAYQIRLAMEWATAPGRAEIPLPDAGKVWVRWNFMSEVPRRFRAAVGDTRVLHGPPLPTDQRIEDLRLAANGVMHQRLYRDSAGLNRFLSAMRARYGLGDAEILRGMADVLRGGRLTYTNRKGQPATRRWEAWGSFRGPLDQRFGMGGENDVEAA